MCEKTFTVVLNHVQAHEPLATYLSLKDNEVHGITYGPDPENFKIIKVLRQWKRKNGFNATHMVLVKSLLNMKDRETADAVVEHVKTINNPAPAAEQSQGNQLMHW